MNEPVWWLLGKGLSDNWNELQVEIERCSIIPSYVSRAINVTS